MENFKIKEIKRKTLKDTIYTSLKEIILNNNFPSDDFITENSLAEKLNVSRTPLREAMQDLVNENLIEFKPRKGYKIKTHSIEEVEQIFLLRFVIEKEIIDPLFEKVTPEKISTLKKIIDRQKDTVINEDGYQFMLIDKEFHRELFLISEYNIFLKSYDLFHNLTILIGAQAIRKKGRMTEVINEHIEIINMLEKKDKEGMIKAINNHLSRTQSMYTDMQDLSK
jgi:DNA-binding GntR family transcriptional regulator